jgi:signal transduction histidine kinase
VAQVFWNAQEIVGWRPFPAPSDPFYLALSPCIAAGFMAVLRQRVSPPQRLAAVLDTLSLSITVVTVTLVAYMPSHGDISPLALGVMVAYPTLLLSAASIGTILAALLRIGRCFAVWGLVLMLAAHGALWMTWNALALRGALEDGGLVNVAFSVCTLVGGLAASAWRPRPGASPGLERVYEGALRLLPLVVVVGVAFAVMLQDRLVTISPTARLLSDAAAVAVIALAAVRQTLLLRDRDQLAQTRRVLQERERELHALNADLESRVAERTREAEARNAELSTAMSQLSLAQHELTRTEKLANLGSLVAGTASDLDATLAHARMIASTLPSQFDSIARMQVGEVRRSQRATLTGAFEASHVQLAQSLEQAQRVVAAMRQVALDQGTGRRRVFDLLETAREYVELMRPGLGEAPVEIAVAGERGVLVDSHPGPLEQVLGQLIENAMVHGFADGREGRIDIRVTSMRDGARLVVQDNGMGIRQSDLSRVFMPFFTTRTARGSTGLGLTLARQLVTGVLEGRIEVDSAASQGTTVTVTLPTPLLH